MTMTVFTHYRINEQDFVARVVPYGEMFLCHGEGFVNIQSSNDYAFSIDKEMAILDYFLRHVTVNEDHV